MPTDSKSISAQEFVLLDESGSQRAVLGAFDGTIGLKIGTPCDKRSVTLGMDRSDQPMISLTDSEGQSRFLAFLSGNSDNPIVSVSSGGTQSQIMMTADTDGAHITFVLPTGKIGAMISRSGEGYGITLHDDKGRIRLNMGLWLDDFSVIVYDRNGQVIMNLPG
jgi:hypothetical protein